MLVKNIIVACFALFGTALAAVPQKAANNTPPAGVLAWIWYWSRQRFPVIQEAKNTQGGWEGWAQVELALMFSNEAQWANAYTIRREERNLWNPPHNNQAADVWFESPNANNYANIAVELKCRPRSEPSYTFVTRFKADITKIHQAVNAAKAPADLWAVAITHDITDTNTDYGAGYNNVRYVEFKPNAFGETIYMLWSN